MADKHYLTHTSGSDDNVLVTMAHHRVSFEVHYFRGKLHVYFGPHCGMQLQISQAMTFRDLLDAGIADAMDEYYSALPAADVSDTPPDDKAVA